MDEDQIALSRLAQGDLRALETLVERYQVQAVYTAYLILHDQPLAEDAAQTAFVNVAEKIHQYDPQRPFRPWFFRIVVNEALKASRQQKRQIPLEEEAGRGLSDWLRDPQPSPETLFEKGQTGRALLDAIKHLEPQQRAVIVMRYYLEMSEAEMSTRLGSPLSTVKWWLRSARERLRSLLRASRLFDEHHDQERR